jgi:crossover junction endodeoxyribonuclease RuvC
VTRVLGVDPSLTATGLAIINDAITGNGHAQTATIRSAPVGPSLTARLARIDDITGDIEAHAGADLVVIEGPSLHSRDAGTWERAGLWWHTIRRIHAYGVPVVEVPPTTVKKFATGKGNADKVAVSVAMSRLWPDVDAASDNEWDALALAHIGAQRLGMDVPSRAHHADALGKIQWPELEAR